MSQAKDGLPWNEPGGPGRTPPRECIALARREMDKAWQTGDWKEAVIFMRGGLDWMRRGLEQMADAAEEREYSQEPDTREATSADDLRDAIG